MSSSYLKTLLFSQTLVTSNGRTVDESTQSTRKELSQLSYWGPEGLNRTTKTAGCIFSGLLTSGQGGYRHLDRDLNTRPQEHEAVMPPAQLGRSVTALPLPLHNLQTRHATCSPEHRIPDSSLLMPVTVLKRMPLFKVHPRTVYGGPYRVQSYSSTLYHNLGPRLGWVVGATSRPLYPLERDPVPIRRVGPKAGLEGSVTFRTSGGHRFNHSTFQPAASRSTD
jgi:hypothetical protein